MVLESVHSLLMVGGRNRLPQHSLLFSDKVEQPNISTAITMACLNIHEASDVERLVAWRSRCDRLRGSLYCYTVAICTAHQKPELGSIQFIQIRKI